MVICAYTLDRWEQLVAAVRSCEAQTLPPTQVIVVIDHAEELLVRSRRAFRDHVVVPNRHQRGLAGARNTGIDVVAAEAVAFLDDDAFADPDWLEHLTGPLADPAVAGTGGAVTPAWAVPRPAWFPEEFLWVVGCSYRGLPREVADIRNPIGANMLFLRDAIQAVGGFREGIGRVGTLPVGCEETEMAIRIRQRGQRILYVPTANVHHVVTAERGTWGYFWSRCLHEGRSKAMVTALVGRSEALASERRYATRVLPRAIGRALAEAIRGPDRGGALGRAGAVLSGLLVTTVGFLGGTARLRRTRR